MQNQQTDDDTSCDLTNWFIFAAAFSIHFEPFKHVHVYHKTGRILILMQL